MPIQKNVCARAHGSISQFGVNGEIHWKSTFSLYVYP